MPIMWRCPGQPKCRKIYLYARGLTAHIPACKHAQKKKVRQKREEVETMLSIIQFVEDQQKGNVTVARRQVPSFRWESPTFTRSREAAAWSRLSPPELRTGRRPIFEEK